MLRDSFERSGEPGDRTRLLVVDDDPNVCDMLRMWAEGAGCHVMSAAGWTEMNLAMQTFAPTIILLDLMIPDVDGIEILHHLADAHSRAWLVLITGADEVFLRTAERLAVKKNLAVAGTLSKPVDLDALRGLLSGILSSEDR